MKKKYYYITYKLTSCSFCGGYPIMPVEKTVTKYAVSDKHPYVWRISEEKALNMDFNEAKASINSTYVEDCKIYCLAKLFARKPTESRNYEWRHYVDLLSFEEIDKNIYDSYVNEINND